MLKKIPKRIKTILVCGIIACGAAAGAALGVMLYQIVKEIEERINASLKLSKIIDTVRAKLPRKGKAK